MPPRIIHIIDSHTAGEPTRVVLAGGPNLGTGPLAERLERFRHEFDHFRTAIVSEPRGSDVLVGALLVPPHNAACAAGVIFFNNVGYLGMCGHGMIGVVTTLAELGRLPAGPIPLETSVGVVQAEMDASGAVSIKNVVSFRKAASVEIRVAGHGLVVGDVAWAGNWFYLIEQHDFQPSVAQVGPMTDFCQRVRRAINEQGFPKVDHVELVAPAQHPAAHAKNFVLCPGGAYDRSPCGTGTSAKLACLAAAGKLLPGEEWVQESVIGSMFRGSYQWSDRTRGEIIPTITGQAYLTADAKLQFRDDDPFRWGIPLR